MGKRRQVIVGNSAAGLSAIKGIREVDHSCPITLISVEECNAYSPVALTHYLKGEISKRDLFIVGKDFYRKNAVQTLFGNRAIEVDPFRQVVRLEQGKKVKYDNLLIATGALAIRLNHSGHTPPRVFSLRTLSDADKIGACARTAKDVIVIGAGLIGLQVADAIFKKGIKLTVLEWSAQVLPEIVDADCATLIQKEIEGRGISVLLGKKVKEIRKRGRKVVVMTDSGGEEIADMVVVGIGVRPNTDLVNGSGIKVNRGILVDGMMQTNFDNIFAAGDVAEGENIVTGKMEVLPNWSNACKQGRIAGLNMAGCRQKYEGGLKETITTIFGLTVAGIGVSKASEGGGLTESRFSDPERKLYRKILLSDNRVAGAVLLGRVMDAGILKNLIRNKKDISFWRNAMARTPLDMRKLLWSVINP